MIMLLGCSPFRDPELPPAGRGADLVSKLTRFCVEAEQLFRTSASPLIGQQVSWRTRRESYNKSPPNRGRRGLVFSRVVLQICTRRTQICDCITIYTRGIAVPVSWRPHPPW
ncbi:hypothetical protein M404DRAFT_436259 [Pisolithus tinctorius Marx 270]|uniref:Uncharacterized protein n=1 Tax=Pisolithus tinctorius Marx 270 TaxID=870435 RepID=A0A0C3JBX9_PISTI|nr:hypothetical protein M404DRAFT_436259 [Pisolithus tinctorius Marx 270]